MARHLILHIGLTKTGSTSIQHVLAVRRPALQALGVYMPTSPGWANHGLLAASLVADQSVLTRIHPLNWGGLSISTRLAQFRAEFQAELANLPAWAKTCLITAEQIGMWLHSDAELAALRDLLAPYFTSMRVIVYLRRQDQHAASYYNQWLRAGRLDPPSLPACGPAELPENDYASLLDRYARIFGAANLAPRIYDRRALAGGDVLEDFLATAGIALEVPKNIARRQSNAGISTTGQALLRALGARMQAEQMARKQGADADDTPWYHSPVWAELCESVTARFPGQGWQPAPAEAAAFLARFEAGNAAVCARFFPGRAALFEPPAPSASPPGEDARENVIDAALGLILHEIAASSARMAQSYLAEYRLMRQLENQPGMRVALQRVLRHDPNSVFARMRLAGLMLAEGKLAQAREHLAVAQRLEPLGPGVSALSRHLARAEARAQEDEDLA